MSSDRPNSSNWGVVSSNMFTRVSPNLGNFRGESGVDMAEAQQLDKSDHPAKEITIADKTRKLDINSSDRTVIGLKGSGQHHDLQGKFGEKGDRTHTDLSGRAAGGAQDAAKNTDENDAIASAMN